MNGDRDRPAQTPAPPPHKSYQTHRGLWASSGFACPSISYSSDTNKVRGFKWPLGQRESGKGDDGGGRKAPERMERAGALVMVGWSLHKGPSSLRSHRVGPLGAPGPALVMQMRRWMHDDFSP